MSEHKNVYDINSNKQDLVSGTQEYIKIRDRDNVQLVYTYVIRTIRSCGSENHACFPLGDTRGSDLIVDTDTLDYANAVTVSGCNDDDVIDIELIEVNIIYG